MAVVYLLIGLIAFAAIGAPLAFSIGASCITYLTTSAPQFLSMMPQRIWNGTYSELMIAMPLFMLAGELMNTGGITTRIINFCMEILRPVHGGLGEVNIVASMIFGGISGSSVADTSALGSILIPAMQKEGYPADASAGITVASSTMGMIIPPSTPMIVYSMVSGASVGALFMAGAVPGIMIGLVQLVLVYIISMKKHWHPQHVAFDGARFRHNILSGIPALLMPLFIIVCVSGGICTASESAGVAVLYSVLVGFFIYRELTWKAVWSALKKTLVSSSCVMIIIGFTQIFTWILTIQKVPEIVAGFFMNMNMPGWGIGLLFDVLILIIGTFIDVSPAILMLTPIMLPVMRYFGFTDLQFGAMMIVGLAIGLVTPPVGMCLNACNKINKMPIVDIFKAAAPYLLCNIIVLILISTVPAFTTWLPALLGYSF
ncbi:MAG: TRAP transporter large permease [Clostridia bacterium]|nr:TRAP transporter large permease [Clostridia bacterium]